MLITIKNSNSSPEENSSEVSLKSQFSSYSVWGPIILKTNCKISSLQWSFKLQILSRVYKPLKEKSVEKKDG